MDEKLRGLNLRHVEVDEICSFVAKKQARLTIEEKATSGTIGDVYLWTALDQDTRLIASYAVGKRSADMARRFMVDLAGRMDFPNPHASDDHAYETRSLRPIIQISTDGFSAYREAIDLAFGPYGVLIKECRNATMAYTPNEMVGADRRVMRGHQLPRAAQPHDSDIHEAVYPPVARLQQEIREPRAYYNFVWRSRHSDQSASQERSDRPPR